MNDSTDILIIGTGFAGLGMAIRLKQAGFEDFVILERATDIGGTWRDNHYPGAACDVESHLYSFSFELNPDWSHMFARQGEIWAYMQRCVDKYDLRRSIRFGSNVSRAWFDEKERLWCVETDEGRCYRARVLIAGCGGLSRPAKPDIRGLERFEGASFHSARWNEAVPLDGRRVGVVGTGASSIQIVPSIVARVGQLLIFQRTPPWIVPRPDRPIGPTERALFRRAPALQRARRTGIFWRRELYGLGFFVNPGIMQLAKRMALAHLERSVRDPELRRRLTPNYVMGCKRILLSNDYYPALERPHVRLVTDPIAEVSPHGIRTTDGTEHQLDAIVLATGFETAEQLAPFEVRGARGATLDEAWRDGGEAYRGTTVAGFPNLFLIVGPNTALGHGSMIFMIESQVEYILGCLRMMRSRGARLVDVRHDVQRAYNASLHDKLSRTVWATGGCSSWYKTRSGKNTTLWPGFMFQYRLLMRTFDPAAYEIT